MAVRISGLKPIVICPATVYLPGDGGQPFPHEFDVHFRRMKESERNAINDRYISGVTVTDEQTGETKNVALTVREVLDEVVVGWGRMLDEAGQPVPYSHAERASANEEYPGLEQAMVISWYDHFFLHQRDAALKNSKAPSATTTAPTTQTATS